MSEIEADAIVVSLSKRKAAIGFFFSLFLCGTHSANKKKIIDTIYRHP